MDLAINVGGVDYTRYLQTDTLKGLEIKQRLNAGNKAMVTLRTPASVPTFPIQTGDITKIFLDGELLFEGTISEYSPKTTYARGAVVKTYNLDIDDYNLITSRRLYTNAFEDTMSGDIVRDIIDTVLAIDGITIRQDTIDEGRLVSSASFDSQRVVDVLDQLARASGFYWFINNDKVLWFKPMNYTNNAPFEINDHFSNPESKNLKMNTLKINMPRNHYRNRMFVRGYGITGSMSDTFQFDGVDSNFLLGFECYEMQSIYVNGIPHSFEIDSGMATAEFLWKFGEPQVRLSKNATLNEGDLIVMNYIGRYAVTATAEDSTEIAARAAIEGTSGIYESIEENKEIVGYDRLFDFINAKLKIASRIPTEISYDTFTFGIAPGMVQRIVSTSQAYNFDLEAIITDVTMTFRSDSSPVISVRGSAGTTLERWWEWFKQAKMSFDSALLSSGVVTMLTSSQENLTIRDIIDVFETTLSNVWDGATWDGDNWG